MTMLPIPANLPAGNDDVDVAVAVCDGYAETLRYVTDAKVWRRWTADDARWDLTPDAEVGTIVAALGKSSARQVESGVRYLKFVPPLQARSTEFDQHPYLFNTKNGTLNLRPLPEDMEVEPGVVLTFPADWHWEFKPHDPADMLTQVAGCSYDPYARCPLWDSFLARVQPDPEVRAWLQKLIGYALVGTQSEHIFPVLWGKGANGKSTFVEVVAKMFGEYSCVAEKSLFKAVRNDGHPTDRKVLLNKRLARSEELPDVELDEPKIKGLTGNDEQTGRGMHEDFGKTWAASWTFLVHSNTKPRLTGMDDGIWRRVALVEFGEKIPESEADPYLKEKLYRELPGILNWALRGYEAFCETGLKPLPEKLRAAVAEYRAESDTVSAFVQRYEFSLGDKVFGLVQEHDDYAKENGLDRHDAGKNYKAVCSALGELGGKAGTYYNPARSKSERGFLNIRPK